MDALKIGNTSGLGGLALYDGAHAFPVQNPDGKGEAKITQRVLSSGPVRATVEITAANVVPAQPDLTARIRCTIYA